MSKEINPSPITVPKIRIVGIGAEDLPQTQQLSHSFHVGHRQVKSTGKPFFLPPLDRKSVGIHGHVRIAFPKPFEAFCSLDCPVKVRYAAYDLQNKHLLRFDTCRILPKFGIASLEVALQSRDFGP